MGENKINNNNNNIKENNEIVPKKKSNVEIDHWTFLEEIEAPMWADLTLEPNMSAKDNDDAWFHTNHLFHNLSARQLRSAFAHPDVGNDFVNFNLQGACSPKLPSSVSKSRGKDYISKPLRNINMISVSTNHPVNGLGGGSSRLDKDPTESSNGSCVTVVTSNLQVAADGRNTRGSLNSQSACTSGVSTSTIITVSQRHTTKLSEISTKEGFGQSGGLLNALKANLRRSCATRPALRVAIRDDRESRGRKSSSGKSSVGSSSIGDNGKSRRSAILSKRDHLEQVKTNVKLKPTGDKSLISNKQNRDESLGVKSREILVVPVKGRVIGNKVVDAPLKKMTAGLKQKECRSSIVRDIGKLALPVKGRAKAQKPVEASFKSGTCSESRIKSRGAVASTCLQAVKSQVSISENVTNRPRIGAPSVKGNMERASHLNDSSCSIKEETKRVALSRITSRNYNMPVVRTIDQKRPAKLSENKAHVAFIGSKVKSGRLDVSKLPSKGSVYHR